MLNILLYCDAAVAILIFAAVLYARVRGHRQIWTLFWAGFFIGMTWEVAFYLNGPMFLKHPAYRMDATFPGHPLLQPLAHSVWDGALFLIGIYLVRLLCQVPTFRRFRFAEIFVLVLWGNLQELGVELMACGSGLWTFLPGPLNPLLFPFGHGFITVVPQLIWTAAPLVYYMVALRIFRNFNTGRTTIPIITKL